MQWYTSPILYSSLSDKSIHEIVCLRQGYIDCMFEARLYIYSGASGVCPDFANVTTYTQLVVGSTYFVPCWWVYLRLQKLRIMKVRHNLNSLCPRWNSYSHSKHKQVTTPACTMGYSCTPPTDEDSTFIEKNPGHNFSVICPFGDPRQKTWFHVGPWTKATSL